MSAAPANPVKQVANALGLKRQDAKKLLIALGANLGL